MRKASSVIEINGNRYDAITGQLIGAVKKITQPSKNHSTGVIDGFVRGSSANAHPVVSPSANKTEPQEHKKPARSAKARLRHTAQAVHRRAQKSQTLMRSSVSKPKRDAQEAEIVKKTITPASASVSPARASRAKTIAKSSHISRFGLAGHGEQKKNHEQPQTIKAEAREREVQSASSSTAKNPAQFAQPKPNVMAGLTNSQLERLLDHALTRAGAHKKTSKKRDDNSMWQRIKIMPKWATISASLAVVLVLGLFFAWQNIPQVSMKLAASRAGVQASVPGYTPPGFGFSGPITYSNGAVSIRYVAGGDSAKSYLITQQKSNLNSESLAESNVPANAQVHEVNGTKVFISSDGSDATWVNQGIRYKVTDQAGLSSDQIMKIAESL